MNNERNSDLPLSDEVTVWFSFSIKSEGLLDDAEAFEAAFIEKKHNFNSNVPIYISIDFCF